LDADLVSDDVNALTGHHAAAITDASNAATAANNAANSYNDAVGVQNSYN